MKNINEILTKEQIALLPTQEEIEQYRHKGWYVTKTIFSDYEIEQAWLGIQRHYQGERDAEIPLPLKPHLLDWNIESTGNSLRVDTYIAYLNQQVRLLMVNPLVGAIAALLTGSEEIRLFTSAAIYKPPQERTSDQRIGWHTDIAYFQTCTSDNLLAAWIPLHDCDETMGTPSFLEGSHLWQGDVALDQLRQEKTFICSDFAALEQRLIDCNQPVNIAHTRLKKGQCCFIHSKVFHYTDFNLSQHPRVAVTLFLQDKANSYRQVYDENGNLIVYTHDLVCRRLTDGSPDYTDPTFCPVLWSA